MINSPLQYPNRAKYNLIPEPAYSADTTLTPLHTYSLADSHQMRTALDWTWGVDHWAFSDAGVPKTILGSLIKSEGTGLRWYAGLKGLALYSSDQTANDTKIKKYLKVPA